MLMVVSPAKKLDFDSENIHQDHVGEPRLLDQAQILVDKAKTLRSVDLKSMMGISDALADLNVARFQAFETPFTPSNARPAMDAFKGDVYVGLDAPTLSDEDRQFANGHLRILSGLYGLLRPLDLMQAYRLEMGVKFPTNRGETLYQFWDQRITELLNEDLAASGTDTLVSLASTEYFKSVKPKALKGKIITPTFKEIKDGRARVISFAAKKARGAMVRYAIDNRITKAEELKNFDWGGYKLDVEASDANTWVFSRLQVSKAV